MKALDAEWLGDVYSHSTRIEFGEFAAYGLGGDSGIWRVMHRGSNVRHPVFGLVLDKVTAIEFARELAGTQTNGE